MKPLRIFKQEEASGMRKKGINKGISAGILFSVLLISWAWASKMPVNSRVHSPSRTFSPPQPSSNANQDPYQPFILRFKKDLWPLITRAESNCLLCHSKKNTSQLLLLPSAEASFKRLLREHFFDPQNPSSLLARLTSQDPHRRMPPPPMRAWSEKEITLLQNFMKGLQELPAKQGVPKEGEQFPPELLEPYRGKLKIEGPDNTFLTYYQLKKKIWTLFGDDWVRDDKDLFNENIALFGGADFVRSFNESSKATPSFLTGVDMMARDIASRAYINRTGPFVGRPENLPDPLKMKKPDPLYRREIQRLYRYLLFREPTEQEVQSAFRFIQNVYRNRQRLTSLSQTLRFELIVQDSQGLTTRKNFSLQITNSPLGLYQEFINQKQLGSNGLVKQKLSRLFTFKAKTPGQQFQISNEDTNGNVSIAGIEIKGPLPEETTKFLSVKDPLVQILGAWRLNNSNGIVSYEDNSENKGDSSLLIPIQVPRDGKYEITVVWREQENLATSVPIEVFSCDPTQHALKPSEPVPPPGEAHFWIDQTLDNIPYWDLKTAFQFGPEDGVEINNANTKRTVVADAVKFVPQGTGDPLLVRGTEAEGSEQWEKFDPGGFEPYNTIGPQLFSDGNKKKGELKILYKPSRKKAEWQPKKFYRVQIIFPGKAGNETQTPVRVRAQASSPIIQLRYPHHAQVGGKVFMDASASYNLQRSPLKFRWIQTGGPRVSLKDAYSPKTSFTVPSLSPQQAAWEGLCRALISHPDFLFTRPRSLVITRDPKERRRLQLVKIAQDLVARPPTREEIRQLDQGAPLSQLINTYLNSQEFKDFYFRRIRLYLESHGTEEEDEPARLWCYIAFNNRPFKEILTADYTVDKNFQRQPRPAYHGKTGLLTMKGFIQNKPGLPHFNYAAQVCEKFLGYVFEVPPAIVQMREGITAAATTDPNSICYSCHKILTPLAYQRLRWTDKGDYVERDESGKPIDDSDRGLVPSYPFKGRGMEAFALQAQHTERFLRSIIQTHFTFFFGREMRYSEDERRLYKRLWDAVHQNSFSIKALIRAIMTSKEYLEGASSPPPPRRKSPSPPPRRTASKRSPLLS